MDDLMNLKKKLNIDGRSFNEGFIGKLIVSFKYRV